MEVERLLEPLGLETEAGMEIGRPTEIGGPGALAVWGQSVFSLSRSVP